MIEDPLQESEALPFVSVIIPVYNAGEQIDRVVTALKLQSYPSHKLEVIFIDNGSSDGTISYLKGQPYLTLSNDQTKNPYISRNIGFKKANGSIIAFLDVTNIPQKDWLQKGVEEIKSGADLVGGHISFAVDKNSTLGEWYDSITFVDVQKYVELNNGTVCGNLFISRDVWEEIGGFPEESRSGMDMFWTRKATAKGFKLVYCKFAIVEKEPREFLKGLKKSYRIGKGHIRSWCREGKGIYFLWWETLKTFSPPSTVKINKKVERRGLPEMQQYKPHLWAISWFNKISMGLGRLIALLK